jgi:hypothetical protein
MVEHKMFLIYDDELDAFELAIPKEERTLNYEVVRSRPALAAPVGVYCQTCGKPFHPIDDPTPTAPEEPAGEEGNGCLKYVVEVKTKSPINER